MRRYLRLFGTPITLLVLLGFLVYGAWWGYRNVMAPLPGSTPAPCVTQSVGKHLTSSQVSVRVLNGGNTVGLAGRVAAQLTSAGFKVISTGNTSDVVTSTVVVGATKDAPEVKLVLGFLKGAKATGDKRTDGTVDVLVGDGFSGFNPKASRQINVPGGTVCLPPKSASPSSSAKPSGTKS
ncbi:MAG TPA: LytR C-terminal domain-containing protein [Propionibacteriaceae bacterium]|nr:LytR C-terminal domain-containing protein [Propionibacteriaceae bacterium]